MILCSKSSHCFLIIIVVSVIIRHFFFLCYYSSYYYYYCNSPPNTLNQVTKLSEYYPGGDAKFYVVEVDGVVVGGGGYARLTDSKPEEGVCELRKMYMLSESRGKGMGRALVQAIISGMKEAGFKVCYLETMRRFAAAVALYHSLGFTPCPRRGCTGHPCEVHMELPLTE